MPSKRHLFIFLWMLSLLGWSPMSIAETEIAPYKLLFQDNQFNVRSYDSLILAEVTQQSNQQNTSFGRLFRFITGNNEKQQKIAMTAPVFTSYSEQHMQMAFVMPHKMTLANTPTPGDPSVTIRATEPQLFAAVRFSGRMTNQSIRQNARELLEWIREKNLEITGELVTAGYNSPYTPPFMRRNEILFPIEGIKKSLVEEEKAPSSPETGNK